MALAAEAAGGSPTPSSKPLRLIPLVLWRQESAGMACGARMREANDDPLLAPCGLLPFFRLIADASQASASTGALGGATACCIRGDLLLGRSGAWSKCLERMAYAAAEAE